MDGMDSGGHSFLARKDVLVRIVCMLNESTDDVGTPVARL